MKRNHWHILADGETRIVSRRLPVRWDVAAETWLEDGVRLRVAQQIRQDLWRKLQRLKGFQPAVAVTRVGERLHVRAGGRVDGSLRGEKICSEIGTLLNSPENRARWLRFARIHVPIVNAGTSCNRFLQAGEASQ